MVVAGISSSETPKDLNYVRLPAACFILQNVCVFDHPVYLRVLEASENK